MTSASDHSLEQDVEDRDSPDQAPRARWRQPVSMALLAGALIALLATRILGSLSGGVFDSVADVGPRPLWALSVVLMLASVAVGSYRK